MASQRSPLCAVIFPSLLLSLHVPAVAPGRTTYIRVYADGHGAAKEEMSLSTVSNDHNVRTAAIRIHDTFGHPALSSVTNQTTEQEIGEMRIGANSVSDASLVMLSESHTKRKENSTMLGLPLRFLAAVHRMGKSITRNRKQKMSDVSNVAGASNGLMTLAGVVAPAAATVSCTVVASLGAAYGAGKTAAEWYQQKNRKIAMKKCESTHKGITITLALIGLAGTATALAIPPAALGAAFVGTTSATASIANRHTALKVICGILEKKLEGDIQATHDVEEGINQFKKQEHLVGADVVTENDADDEIPEGLVEDDILSLEDTVAEGSTSDDVIAARTNTKIPSPQTE